MKKSFSTQKKLSQNGNISGKKENTYHSFLFKFNNE